MSICRTDRADKADRPRGVLGSATGGREVGRFYNGWIKFHRSALEGDIGCNPNTLALWVWLLSLASVRESKIRFEGDQEVLPPGSIATGYKELESLTGISKTTIYRELHYLEKTNRITLKSGTDGTLVTICNWAIYQSTEESVERERNADGTLAERERNLIEEYKNKRNIYAQEFETIWKRYPQGQKSKAFKGFQKQIKTEEDFRIFSQAVDSYLAHCKKQNRYLKDLSTFLGTERSGHPWKEFIKLNVATIHESPEDLAKRIEQERQKKLAILNQTLSCEVANG
jgi:hypothetical protein